ncbi:uncharacterized protein [Nicotiana tomentosiformis]|uniref:uncharacterized protein isoform X1 n=1 Tax=Nicotiana tomentosiformis TaxID=4098 RepID=UPI00051C5F72|nr:uncharacterized protein LOC104114586 isoform X1 [Nicotiana tomentosiformis]XP_018632645.1 uncharacterized protein LOC104114586 isoform X1 [Nicotiana tomentosiformis]
MVSTRRSKSCNHFQEQTLCASGVFHHLISLLQQPQGVRLHVLKSLYYLLVHFSLNPQHSFTHNLGFDDLGMEIDHNGLKASSEDTETLSGVLFEELYERFDHLFSASRDTSANDLTQGNLQRNISEDAEIFYLLLRCCMVTLPLLVSRHNLLLEKGKVLLVLLRKLCSINTFGAENRMEITFEKSVSQACTSEDNECRTTSTEDFVASLHFFEPSDLHTSFLRATFEVFVDELLVHGQLRQFFKLIDSLASSAEIIFTPQPSQGDIGIVMEVFSRYFLISWSDEHRSGNLSRLLLVNNEYLKFSLKAQELSPTAAVALLLNPISLSAPKLMQAHLISMVYEASFLLVDMQNLNTNDRPINYFLALFEKSVALYMKHMSLLQINRRSSFVSHKSVKGAEGKDIQSLFDLCILASTRKEINNLILKFEDSSQSHFLKLSSEMKSDLSSSCITYVKESRYILDKCCQDEIFSALSCLILRASDSFEENTIVDTSLQDICLLVCILKLMSSSLLQVVWCLRCNLNSDRSKTLQDFSSCGEYNSILGIIDCFRDVNIDSSVQNLLCQMTEIDSEKHRVSKMMFLHFAGLLSVSFFKRLDCLAKGCLFTIIALLNLFIFEEGNLDILQSLVGPTPDSVSSSGLSAVRIQEAVVDKRSSLVVASKFQKARALRSRRKEDSSKISTSLLYSKENFEAMEEETEEMEEEMEETTNGKIFLKCRLGRAERVPDFDDLADFIECKQGKDYPFWLKHWQQYRKLKCDKMALLRWKRKKKSWKVMKRN